LRKYKDSGCHLPVRRCVRSTDPLLRPDQAASLLAVKASWVYDAVRTGNLPCIRVGRHIRFSRSMGDLRCMLELPLIAIIVGRCCFF
jgi:excisionase family DNA binding protein